jgi:hypothetical protein
LFSYRNGSNSQLSGLARIARLAGRANIFGIIARQECTIDQRRVWSLRIGGPSSLPRVPPAAVCCPTTIVQCLRRPRYAYGALARHGFRCRPPVQQLRQGIFCGLPVCCSGADFDGVAQAPTLLDKCARMRIPNMRIPVRGSFHRDAIRKDASRLCAHTVCPSGGWRSGQISKLGKISRLAVC